MADLERRIARLEECLPHANCTCPASFLSFALGGESLPSIGPCPIHGDPWHLRIIIPRRALAVSPTRISEPVLAPGRNLELFASADLPEPSTPSAPRSGASNVLDNAQMYRDQGKSRSRYSITD